MPVLQQQAQERLQTISEPQTTKEVTNQVHSNGGFPAQHLDFWQSLTSDRYVKGYSLELADHDFLLRPPSCDSVFNLEKTKQISGWIQELLGLAVIEPCNHDIGELISPIFLVSKSDGSHRKIINLKHLNKSVTYEHFKIENIASLCQLVTPGAHMT